MTLLIRLQQDNILMVSLDCVPDEYVCYRSVGLGSLFFLCKTLVKQVFKKSVTAHSTITVTKQEL